MNISFENKRVLVTGAGRGIGKSIALAFAKGNAEKVFALSKTKSNLDQLVAEEPRIIPVNVDLSDWDAAKKIVDNLGPIDILVNNAAVIIREPFMEITTNSFDTQFNVNVKSVIMVSQAVIKGMVARKQGGSIVNVSSRASKVGVKEHAVYCATKAALDAVTRVMAAEFGEHQIRVNCVNPGLVNTDMGRPLYSNSKFFQEYASKIPLGRISEPEDVVNAVLFLASEKAGMIHGHSLPVEGGMLAV